MWYRNTINLFFALLFSFSTLCGQYRGSARSNWQAGAASGSVTITSLGAQANGTNATATTAAMRAAFTKYPTGQIIVPAGTYLIDNSAGPFVVNNFSGIFQFQTGAQLVFTSNSNGGIWFSGGSGARIYSYSGTYQTLPESRVNNSEHLKFLNTTDTQLTDATVEGSLASGILFFESVRPVISGATITNTMADGLHLANCQNAQVTNLTTRNTGDDGLAFLNYGTFTNNTGGTANNINVYNSQARGITVIGQSGVTITTFHVENTSSSGILCGTDPNFDTRVPSSVTFSQGTIIGAGTLAPVAGNQYGIEYFNQNSCTFSNIQVTGSGTRGLGGTAPSGSVTVSNVQVTGNQSAEAFAFFQTSIVAISDSTAESVPAYGFYFNQTNTLTARNLTAINSSQTFPLHRAIWFDDVTNVNATNIQVVDNQTTPTGYVVGAGQSLVTSTGSVSLATPAIQKGALQIQDYCPKLTIH